MKTSNLNWAALIVTTMLVSFACNAYSPGNLQENSFLPSPSRTPITIETTSTVIGQDVTTPANFEITPTAQVAEDIAPTETRQILSISVLHQVTAPLFTDSSNQWFASMVNLDTSFSREEYYNALGADLQFTVQENSGNKQYFLKPINGSVVSTIKFTASSFEECQQEISSFTPEEIPIVTSKMGFCVLTDEGHLSFVRINKLNDFVPDSLQITYVTWDRVFGEQMTWFATQFPTTATPTSIPATPLPPTSTPEPDQAIREVSFIRLLPQVIQRDQSGSYSGSYVALDLDSGELTDDERGDVFYGFSCGTDCFFSLNFLNEAQGIQVSQSSNIFDTCSPGWPAPLSLYLLPPVNDYICVRTNEGRLSILHIEQYGPFVSNLAWVEVSYITYEETVAESD